MSLDTIAVTSDVMLVAMVLVMMLVAFVVLVVSMVPLLLMLLLGGEDRKGWTTSSMSLRSGRVVADKPGRLLA